MTCTVDADLLVESIKFMKKLMTTGPLAQYHQKFSQPPEEIQTDEQIKEWLLKYGKANNILARNSN